VGGENYPKYGGNILTFGYKTPPGMYKTPVNHGINYQPQLVFTPDFLPSTVSWLVVSTLLKKYYSAKWVHLPQNSEKFPKICELPPPK